MLISEEVEVKWNGFTRKWYEERGYKWTKANDLFICKIEDLQPTSTVKVQVKCDYCGETHPKEYRYYFKGRQIVDKDCCESKKCLAEKTKEISLIKYGVTNHMKTKESQEHLRQIWKTPFEEVKKLCEEKGLILLSSESDYQNDRSRLKIICTYHEDEGSQDTNFANIKKNKGCCKYGKFELAAESTRLDGNVVFNFFKDKGLIPQFKPSDYKNNETSLPYICEKHPDAGIQYRTYGSLQQFEANCKECCREARSNANSLSEKFVFDYFKQRSLIIEEGEIYNGVHNHIKFRCPKHMDELQSVTYHSLTSTQEPCDYCRIEKSMIKLERKLRNWISKWRKESEKLCGFKCVLTGDSNYEIHHKKSFISIIKEAIDNLNMDLTSVVNNYTGDEFVLIKNEVLKLHKFYGLGVCLRKDVHMLLHQLYGKDNIEQKDFDEFCERYKNKEFNIICKKEVAI